jgi:hypothetical protein
LEGDNIAWPESLGSQIPLKTSIVTLLFAFLPFPAS